MKMIARTDLIIQAMLFLAWALLICLEGPGGKALLAGMILLNWQIISSLIMTLFRQRFRTECTVFIVAAVAFQVLVNILFVTMPGLIDTTAMTIVNGLPPVLAACYLVLTIISVVRRPGHRGNFLPNISF
jgi:hypothetical protein